MARPIDDIAEVLTDAIIAALKDREGELKDIAKAGGAEAGPSIFGDAKAITGIITDVLNAVPIVGDLVGLPLEPLKLAEEAAGKGGLSFAWGYALGQLVYYVADPIIAPLQHAVADALQTGIFDPATAATLQAKGILTQDDARSAAHGGNMSSTDFDKLADAAQSRPALGELIELMRIQAIQQADFAKALERAGIPAFWWEPLQQLVRNRLPAAELALGVLRGNIDPGFGQQYAANLGFEQADFQILVDNTGEPISLTDLQEAYRRDIIDKARLEHGIRQSRVRDEWIDVVESLRYAPMSTADAARAVVENYLPDADGAAIAQQNGLLPDHWRFIVESWGRPLSHEQMLTLYHRQQATLDEVKQALRESDIKDKYVDKAIELGRALIPERTIVSMIDHGVLGHDDGITLLKERGYNDADAELLVKLGAAQRISAHKTLTKGDIISMYSDALLNRVDALGHLEKLGYNEADATDMLDLADFKRKASQLKIIERGIQASLKAHHITEQQAVAQLTQAGLDNAQAQIFVDEWLQERKLVTRLLTEKQIIDATFAKIITLDDAKVRLQTMGFSAGDVDIILKLNGLENV